MLRQSHAALVFLVPKILLAGIESLLESLRSQASVIPLVLSSNIGLRPGGCKALRFPGQLGHTS